MSGRCSPVTEIALILAFWLCIAIVFETRYRSPEMVANSAGTPEFSTADAEVFLRLLFADELPRPAASAANAMVREKLVATLQQMGMEVELQETAPLITTARWPGFNGRVIPVVNVIARHRAPQSQGAPILLACHYDSVPAGPGICDDGFGVAACLTICGMMAQVDWRRDVVVLFSDAEELGIVGAGEFVRGHRWAGEPTDVVNLEARGTTGAALMFETGSDSLRSIRVFSRIGALKFTGSVFYEIYRRLPRDTDFTHFKRAGMQGLNLAFIGRAWEYHTPDDNLANGDRKSLQHLGDSAWQLLRQLDQTPPSESIQRAVYCDLLGAVIIWWPEPWSIPFASVLWLLLAGFMVRESWRVVASGGSTGLWRIGLRQLVAALAIAAALTVVYFFFSLAGLLGMPWPYQPWWGVLSLLTAGGCGLLLIMPQSARIDGRLVSSVQWLGAATLGLIVAIFVAGASYLFLLPSAVAMFCGMASWWSNIDRAWVRVVPAAAAGLWWIPLERLFFDAVGLGMGPALIVRWTLLLMLLAPSAALLQQRERSVCLICCLALLVSSHVAFVLANQ